MTKKSSKSKSELEGPVPWYDRYWDMWSEPLAFFVAGAVFGALLMIEILEMRLLK